MYTSHVKRSAGGLFDGDGRCSRRGGSFFAPGPFEGQSNGPDEVKDLVVGQLEASPELEANAPRPPHVLLGGVRDFHFHWQRRTRSGTVSRGNVRFGPLASGTPFVLFLAIKPMRVGG